MKAYLFIYLFLWKRCDILKSELSQTLSKNLLSKTNCICSNPTLAYVCAVSSDLIPHHQKYSQKMLVVFIMTRENKYEEHDN